MALAGNTRMGLADLIKRGKGTKGATHNKSLASGCDSHIVRYELAFGALGLALSQ